MCNLSDGTKPPNLKAGDDEDSKEHDVNEITDQNGINLPKKRSNRLAGKQKVDYKLLNGIQKLKGKKGCRSSYNNIDSNISRTVTLCYVSSTQLLIVLINDLQVNVAIVY